MKLLNRTKGPKDGRGSWLVVEVGDIIIADRLFVGKGTTMSLQGACHIQVTKRGPRGGFDRRPLRCLIQDRRNLRAVLKTVERDIAEREMKR